MSPSPTPSTAAGAPVQKQEGTLSQLTAELLENWHSDKSTHLEIKKCTQGLGNGASHASMRARDCLNLIFQHPHNSQVWPLMPVIHPSAIESMKTAALGSERDSDSRKYVDE